ncbi:hypothetical protein JOB18_015711 [Solea senegalensis]|uniref:Uncharacterized protein n=1 Tax=Solea senegalensis TaxID=28829 RepID=A0AAV6SYA9_SOLSE|nr:hypothetical protein JOB18_015711 [Solea senegalensis]
MNLGHVHAELQGSNLPLAHTQTHDRISISVMPTSELWVGTWRPHRPAGPISAHCLSPGPKYALPGLTGASKHDFTRYKAPMFSFGIRHEQCSSDCSPGPKYQIPSNITRVGRGGSPAFVCSSRTNGSRLYQTPGPGPAAYSLPPVLGHKTAPSFSLGGFTKSGSFLENLKTSPSPAAYKVVDPGTYMQKPPQYSITGRNFAPDSGTKTPGPGSHYPERVKKNHQTLFSHK